MAIFTAIGATVATALGLAAGTFGATVVAGVTAAALEVASGVALNLIASSIAGNGANAATQFAVQGTLQAGGDIERSFPLGIAATGGSLVYANAWGEKDDTPNAFFTQVICVSDLPTRSGSSGLTGVYVDGVAATIDWSNSTSRGYPVKEYSKDGVNHLWLKFYDGTQTSADSFLTDKVSTSARPYNSSRVGLGCAYVIVTSLVNDGLFSGFPKYRFVLGPTKLYDPSKDSSVGGSGTQRYADTSTWGGDGDSLTAVQLYNVLRGFRFGGQWLYGFQSLPVARLPVADWINQINKCRATVAGENGLEATYRSGGEVGVNATIADTISVLLSSCQGRMIEVGGVYKLRLGVADAPVFSFDDGLILSSEEQSFTPFYGIADTINGITAKFPDPTQAWNSVVAPPLFKSAYETADGGRRLLADVSLDFVPYRAQVQRLMKAALAEARRARRHTFVLPPQAWVLEPGDIVAWTSARNGYIAKLFRVDGIVDRANLDVMLDVTEVDPSDYDWSQTTDFKTIADGSLILSRPSTQPMFGFGVAPYTFPASDGTLRRFGITVSYTGGLVDIRAVSIEVREGFGSNHIVYQADINYDKTEALPSKVVSGSFLYPATVYQVRGKFLPKSGRDTAWSEWLSVTTPDVRLGAGDFVLDGMKLDLAAFDASIVSELAALHQQARDFQKQAADLATLVADQDFSNYASYQQIKQEVKDSVGQSSARATSLFVAAASDNAAMAARLEILAASIDDTTADAVAGLQTQVSNLNGKVTAQSADIVSLKDAVGSKASSDALATLSSMVSSQGDAINAQSADIVSLKGVVAKKASSDVVSALQSVVSSQGDNIDSHSTYILSLQNALKGYTGNGAVASAISSLSNSISATNGNVSVAQSAVTALQGDLGYSGGSAVIAMNNGYTPPAGWQSAISMQVRSLNGSYLREAGLILLANPASAGLLLYGDKVQITNGSDIAALFTAGTTYIATARIRDLTADSIRVKSLYADTVLVDGSVITDLVANNNITVLSGSTISSDLQISNNATPSSPKTIASITMTPKNGGVIVIATVNFRYSQTDGNAYGTLKIAIAKNGNNVGSGQGYYDDSVDKIPSVTVIYYDSNPGTGSTTYAVTAVAANNACWYVKAISGSGIVAINGKK